uniref:HAUS augmin-like complex subunit 4 n=1 Tax=Geotrypetes seraphini TaxID=260995 RepID=A0A6P8PUC9_GEOSA|nr:HAUS augmin-like complex subunit 4 [Geotrypetes seraphini]XP_033778951.1 HAUS augmin-like complex subunit 4 [Geotrypetes seraphini]
MAGTSLVSASSEYSDTLLQVCSRLPPCQVAEEDLSRNPQFTKLLLEVSQHIDESGLSVLLRKELDEAEKELRLQKKAWLRSEVIDRLIREMLLEYRVKLREPGLNPEDQKFYESLEQCLLVSECSQMLDPPGAVTVEDQPPLLGLNAQDLQGYLPMKKDLLQVRDQLHREIEERLKHKCFSLLCFHQPEANGDSEVLKAAKASRLAMTLEDEKRRLCSEKEKHTEMMGLLEKQRHAYPQVLLRCLDLLRTLAVQFRLQSQSETDRSSAQYLETKCTALFLKIRMEELQILTDTYTNEKVEVHGMIRDDLQQDIQGLEQDVQSCRQILNAYEILGPEFEELAKEYTRLKQELQYNKWALEELGKSSS